MKKYRLPLIWIAALALSLGFVQGAFSQNPSWLCGQVSAPPEALSFRSMSEVQITKIFQDQLPPSFQGQSTLLARHVIRLSRRYEFHPAFVLALIQMESGFNPLAHSKAGALGLMQLMPKTARGLARRLHYGLPGRRDEVVLRDPFVSLSLGVAYLHELRLRYPEASPYYMLAAYILGPGRLQQLLSHPKYRPSLAIENYIRGIHRGVDAFKNYSDRNGTRV